LEVGGAIGDVEIPGTENELPKGLCICHQGVVCRPLLAAALVLGPRAAGMNLVVNLALPQEEGQRPRWRIRRKGKGTIGCILILRFQQRGCAVAGEPHDADGPCFRRQRGKGPCRRPLLGHLHVYGHVLREEQRDSRVGYGERYGKEVAAAQCGVREADDDGRCHRIRLLRAPAHLPCRQRRRWTLRLRLRARR
jgi:hypothetical protein